MVRRAPSANMVKVNVDGGAFMHYGFGGVGVVIRDNHGSFLDGKAVRIEGVMDVDLLEARAI